MKAFSKGTWWLIWAGGLTALAGLAAVYYQIDPEGGRFPACPLFSLTGLYCTGCGSQRAAHDLLHGNLWESLGHNLLFFPTAIVLFWHLGAGLAKGRLREIIPKSPLERRLAPKWLLYAIGFFTLLRNLPWEPFAWLAP